MNSLNDIIENHYFKQGLFEEIIHRLEEQGIDLDSVDRSDISGVDEFHVRGAEVSIELSHAINLYGKDVLDVGCGIGGPSRMLADDFDCQVTGIDLSKEFIRTAQELSKLVKLDHKTRFIVGDAVNLPFESNSYDVVWTQHVQMNVPDKETFYSEIYRVLRPGGHFLYYDIFRKNDRTVVYPMPWATTAEQSFLFKTAELAKILSGLGCIRIKTMDQTQAGIGFFESLIKKLETSGPPKMGLNVLMGESTKPKLLNLLHHFNQGILMLESGICIKK